MDDVAKTGEVCIVLARYIGEYDKAWKIVKVCKSRADADRVMDYENHVDVVLERLVEYKVKVLRGF